MSRYRKITTICCAAVFALGLAACGGGDDGLNTSQEQELQEEKKAADEMVAELQEQLAALQERLGIEGDEDPGHDVAGLQAEIQRLQGLITAAEEEEQTEAEKAAAKAMTADAKALKMAIGSVNALPTKPDVMTSSIPVIGTTTAIPLKKGDGMVAMLGGWNGTDYAGMVGTGAAMTTGMVRFYSDAAAATKVPFTGEAGDDIHGLDLNGDTDAKGDYTVTATSANPNIAGSGFPTTGTHTYMGDARKFAGTFMGASGTYECTGNSCTASAQGQSGIALTAGTWTFTPSAGATLDQKDSDYLHFGWWVRKDKDGPTHAGAIYGAEGHDALTTEINDSSLVGKASYMGKAAGKFAVSDPLRSADDNSGHFTADAELMADFKDTGSTLSGTIDNFRLNDGSDDPGWSVALQKAMFETDKFGTAETPDDDRTVWSIGGAKGAASGSWEAQMYDDKKDDGSNVPDTVLGSFHSMISNTHEMVGAFGAEKQ